MPLAARLDPNHQIEVHDTLTKTLIVFEVQQLLGDTASMPLSTVMAWGDPDEMSDEERLQFIQDAFHSAQQFARREKLI